MSIVNWRFLVSNSRAFLWVDNVGCQNVKLNPRTLGCHWVVDTCIVQASMGYLVQNKL